jgi:hypothetical protein
MKICTKCKVNKELFEFNKRSKSKDGLCLNCKECQKKYRKDNRLKINESKKKSRMKNPEKYRKQNCESYKRENRDKIKNRWKKDRIKRNLRNRIRNAIKTNTKSAHTIELLGCTISELKQHLERQFTYNMTWENYGFKGWHIDHIIPCAIFDLSNQEQQRQCFHYSNLQPLWWYDNLRKYNKII